MLITKTMRSRKIIELEQRIGSLEKTVWHLGHKPEFKKGDIVYIYRGTDGKTYKILGVEDNKDCLFFNYYLEDGDNVIKVREFYLTKEAPIVG